MLELKGRRADGRTVWAYRYRFGGRGSRRVQRGGFASEHAGAEALVGSLERLRRERGLVEAPRSRELVDVYFAQHDCEPETVEKLRWLLAKAVRSFGQPDQPASPSRDHGLAHDEPPGHRFEATQALRQVLARARAFDQAARPVHQRGADVHAVDAAWTQNRRTVAHRENATTH